MAPEKRNVPRSAVPPCTTGNVTVGYTPGRMVPTVRTRGESEEIKETKETKESEEAEE